MYLADIYKICQLVEGSPLAIELAAAWVRAISCKDIATEIEKGLDILSTTSADVPERHRSLKATFEHSWHLLNQKEQSLLSKLAVFQGGFDRKAAAEVANASYPLLASLVDKSLLWLNTKNRYSFHPLLSEFARAELARDAALQRQTEERHSQYFYRFLLECGEDIWSATGKSALKAIDQELDNILLMWQMLVRSVRFDLLKGAVLPLMWFYDHRARYLESVELYQHTANLLDKNNNAQRGLLGVLLVSLAWWGLRLGQHEYAQTSAEKGLELLRPSGEKAPIMLGLASLGGIYFYLGNYDKATGYKTEALKLARELENPTSIAFHATVLGNLEAAKGNSEVAKRYFIEALQLCREHEIYFQLVATLSNLSFFYAHHGEPKKAYALACEGLKLAREIGLKQEIPYLLSTLADVAFQLESFSEGESYAREAIEISKDVGNPEFWIYALIVLGKSALAQGNHSKAQDYLFRAFRLALSVQREPEMLETLLHYASLRATQGDQIQALQWLHLGDNSPH